MPTRTGRCTWAHASYLRPGRTVSRDLDRNLETTPACRGRLRARRIYRARAVLAPANGQAEFGRVGFQSGVSIGGPACYNYTEAATTALLKFQPVAFVIVCYLCVVSVFQCPPSRSSCRRMTERAGYFKKTDSIRRMFRRACTSLTHTHIHNTHPSW